MSMATRAIAQARTNAVALARYIGEVRNAVPVGDVPTYEALAEAYASTSKVIEDLDRAASAQPGDYQRRV